VPVIVAVAVAVNVHVDAQRMMPPQADWNSIVACMRPTERSPSQIDEKIAFVPTAFLKSLRRVASSAEPKPDEH
jgi:hypothetical protein